MIFDKQFCFLINTATEWIDAMKTNRSIYKLGNKVNYGTYS